MSKRSELLTDEELMLSVSRGNLDNMRFLFDRYHLRIYNYLLKMTRDRAVSQDLCQEVFYKALKYRESYRGSLFTPWLFKIAKNAYFNHYQTHKNKSQDLDILQRYPAVENPGSEQSEAIEQLYWAIEQLNEKDKSLLLLNRLQGIQYQDLAEMVGSNTGAIKTKIHRIIAKLRVHFFKHN